MSQYLSAAEKLHQFLIANQWQDGALIGPDPGVRFNFRIGRFVKGYLPTLPWNDALYYLQGQGYWVLGNWTLADRTGKQVYQDLAVQASDQMLMRQRSDGAWDYPNPEWRGRVANAEGTWGMIGLLASYRKTKEPRFLDGVLRWHRYLIDEIGFQRSGETMAVNYFAGRTGGRVPNNSGFVLAFLADLADTTGQPSYCDTCPGMLSFMNEVQMASGEFPYEVRGVDSGGDRLHYQCFQYNAFQCLDLIKYWQLTGDEMALPLIRKVLAFLQSGLAPDGHSFYDCERGLQAVTYHAAVLGAAFFKATQTGIADLAMESSRAYAYVLAQQRPDGSFPHSRRDYQVLNDQRAYPRYLAMIMYHLLLPGMPVENSRSVVKEWAPPTA